MRVWEGRGLTCFVLVKIPFQLQSGNGLTQVTLNCNDVPTHVVHLALRRPLFPSQHLNCKSSDAARLLVELCWPVLENVSSFK